MGFVSVIVHEGFRVADPLEVTVVEDFERPDDAARAIAAAATRAQECVDEKLGARRVPQPFAGERRSG
jgi:hypothetical protein